MSQKPAFILNIEAPPGTFDINLSPDKREVLFSKQKNILGRCPVTATDTAKGALEFVISQCFEYTAKLLLLYD